MFKQLLTGIAAITLFSAATPSIISSSTNTVHASTYSRIAMRSYVRNVLAQNNSRGSTVIIKNGKPQQISYGWAWYGKRIGNGNDSVVYPTASLQKVVTAAMVVQLMNEKWHTSERFSQNTKISRWYPELKNANNITLGQLINHTSGINAVNTEADRGINYSEDDAVKWAIDNANAINPSTPGTYFYNNTNYILLAGIIKKISGQSYETNFNNRIVNKLGLANTYLYQNIPSWKTDPISYTWNIKNYQDPEYITKTQASQLVGAANMFTTPMDYYKIQVGLSNGAILNKSDFHYLTHLKSRANNYSGGIYLDNNDTIKSAYGNLGGTHFGIWFQMTTDNRNGLIMFLNQTAGDENAQKQVGYQILNHIKPYTFIAG
ncbi:class A beta-lactamase-related serine hydrolase [Lactobacillus helveticus]|nr:class A beta-lactamase-related serine hydrolase [Lactobacillus helveticus]MCT3404502.1 class A beta-lactamase-related serine hydrolase [Lactobacillus helveticus]MCT3408401.1 class A beta-lactamase-related serine hydrolase [Lactobacillus helveticus]MCT3420132.1 class A beta-lactamase-related serine hydrolase [Lactobacillus helveticus]MCT3421163.1 class A beta-lactamase-related serine hydrolase [Lactobacillus helveticus]